MILVVDTNVVFAGLLKASTTRELLIDSQFIMYSPESMLKEIRKYERYILDKSGLSREEFETLFQLITDSIIIVEQRHYAHKIQEANQLMDDKGDVPFLALALSISTDGIWTENARHFNKQNKVKIWSTADLMSTLPK